MYPVQTLQDLGRFLYFSECLPPHTLYRGLQTRSALTNLLNGANAARKKLSLASNTTRIPKLVVKIAPDLSEPELLDIASVIRENEVDGVIVSNTTISRPPSLMNGRFFSRPAQLAALK